MWKKAITCSPPDFKGAGQRQGELGWGQSPVLLSCLGQPRELGKPNYLLKEWWFIWLCQCIPVCVPPLFLPEARERSHRSMWSSHFHWPLLMGRECRKIKAATFHPEFGKPFRLPENQFGTSLWGGPIIPTLIHQHSSSWLLGFPGTRSGCVSASHRSSNTLSHSWHHTKPNATFYLGAEQEKKHRREKGNTCSKKLLTT